MTTNSTIFLLSKRMLIILRCSTSPMQIRSHNIYIIFHANKSLYFVIFFQC